MRSVIKLILLFAVSLFTSSVAAQNPTERLQRLRQELAEVQAQEAQLRARLEQLNEAVKPENIERSLAGIGSTRPEELREHRRRMLTIERDDVTRQLQRLEAAVGPAQNETYLRSAQSSPGASTQMFVAANFQRSRWLWVALPAGLVGITGGAALLVVRRRKRSV